MKKFILLTFSVSLLFFTLKSQSCLPEGIIFYNQQQIDNFQTNYPDCTEIEGNVTIGNDGYETDISSLSGLDVITSIGGDLHIITNINLTDFSGLETLENIEGNFTIEDNDAIEDFSGFDGLESIGGDMYIIENDNLTSFSGMGALTTVSGVFEMGHNLTFSSFSGLSSLTTTGGFEINYIHNMPTMEGLSELTQINGNVRIVSCHALVNFTGLTLLQEVSGFLYIGDNPELVSTEGLEELTTVGGNLEFGFGVDDKFVSFAGLSSLNSVGGNLTIAGTNLLEKLDGLEPLTSIGGDLLISGNNKLASLEGIANIDAQSIGSMTIRYNPMLSDCEVTSICDYLQIPGGNVNINNNLAGCNSEAEVNAACATGITDPDNQNWFEIYPNPATGKIIIRMNDKVKLQAISIYNLLGEKVLYTEPSNTTVDISALVAGLYVIEIESDYGKSLKKLVVE